MAITSKKDSAPNALPRSASASERPEDRAAQQTALRPETLDEYVGQTALKEHLRVSIASALLRKAPLEHVLFYGPPGLGKTTLANILAREMGAHLRQTSGPAVEKPAELVSILTSLQPGDVLFIDEIHRLRPAIEEILYSAMEDCSIDIMIGSGTGATSVTMAIAPFTLVGATTRVSDLSNPLRDRFGNVLKLDLYAPHELETIAKRSFGLLGLDAIGADAARAVAARSRGTPRIANRYVKIIRDYATIWRRVADAQDVSGILSEIGIDALGLDALDRRVLAALAVQFAGRPVGLGTLAAYAGEEEWTLEDVVEPFLLKLGFIERTPRGRQITPSGDEYVRTLG